MPQNILVLDCCLLTTLILMDIINLTPVRFGIVPSSIHPWKRDRISPITKATVKQGISYCTLQYPLHAKNSIYSNPIIKVKTATDDKIVKKIKRKKNGESPVCFTGRRTFIFNYFLRLWAVWWSKCVLLLFLWNHHLFKSCFLLESRVMMFHKPLMLVNLNNIFSWKAPWEASILRNENIFRFRTGMNWRNKAEWKFSNPRINPIRHALENVSPEGNYVIFGWKILRCLKKMVESLT